MNKIATLSIVLALFCAFFAQAQISPTGGIVYVTPNGSGNGSGWNSATNNLQAAIDAPGVTKVFVAVGNYPAPANGFVMKNNVAIYGGFDPANGITTLAHNRILPTEDIEGAILNGESTKRIITNDNNGLNNTAILDGFTIKNGYASGFGRDGVGGGIYNNNSSPTFFNLVIRNNLASNSGGGIANFNSPIILSNTLFLGNSGIVGGGIFNQGSNTSLSNVIFKGNTSGNMGGVAIYSAGGTTTVTNALITGNYQLYYITSASNANIILNNVTIANNNGQYAMRIVGGGTITANNSIIFGTPLIEDGTYTAQNTFTQGNTNTANGNINTSGLSITDVFKSPYAGDFTLKSSLLINKGNNALFPNLNANTKDLAGNPRLLGSAIDLGAYEFEPITPTNGIVYVKANGSGNGSGWNSATNNLQAAIDAPGVTKVFVAVGTYPVGSSSFIMKNGVEIYGGFDPGAGITTLAHNRILPNKGMGDGSVLDGENTRPVIWNDNNGLNNTAVLDGFTIKRGYTNSDGGGGIHNKSVSPVFNNLVVRDNSAKEGAGMWNSSSSPVMTNVVFQNNIATAGPGGAMYNMISSTATITNAVFKGNESTQFAGGVMYNFTSSSATLTNVLIVENVATTVAAIVQSVNGNLTLNNVSIFNNNIAQALYVSSNGTATINNSIILGAVDAGSGGTLSSQYSFIQGNTNTANGNVNTSGLTATDIFTNPSASDYSLKHPSVINKGNNTLFPGLAASTKDLAGNLRLVGTKIDLGAYEYQASIIPDANGIIYVRPTAQGNGDGSSWNDATNDLHNAIHLNGVQKVFVAVGTYPVGSSSFIMKNGVKIYGGFDPANNIKTLSDNRILPTESTAGSVLNGENTRPLIWNNDNGLSNTAILDGFTLTNGSGTSGGAIFNVNVAPVFNNLVIKNNTASVSGGAIYNVNSPIKLNNTIITNNTAQYGGGVRNNGSNSEFTNIIIKNNTATLATAGAGGGGIFNENSALKLTNVLIANNSTNFQGGGFRNLSGNPIFTNVTIANNTAVNQTATAAIEIAGGNPQINNSIIFGSVSGSYTPQYSMIEGNANFSNGNIAIVGITDVFTNPSGGNYTLKFGSYAVNAGSNALFTGLDANTKDLAGNARVYNYVNSGKIDMGAYESTYTPITPTSGIVYVTPNGTGNGSSWANATSDLHTAIQANGVSKVFVAVGNYNVGINSFIMKSGVEIYGGFDPANGITDLVHKRIMPNAANTNGSILNGEGVRPVIWNVFTSGTAMTNTAVLDGFTIFNGSYSNGAGIRNVYASPTLRNLVIRGNTSTGTGAGIYNENSSPDIYNTVISGNMIIAPFGQSGMGAGVYNGTNSAPTIVNTTIADNTITGIGASPVMVGAGVANLSGANPKIYNSIIWNNQKNGLSNVDGADIESNGASLTLKNSITQKYTTGNSGDNNKVGSNPLFAGADFKLQSNSPAVNAGNNSLYTFSGVFDLAGNQRVSASAIDMGAYEYMLLPDGNGIIYVRAGFTGIGSSWADATSDLHNAIQTTGVQKVFVAIGNYPVGANSFVMKNNVEIYGGFDPANNIKTLNDTRILPTKGTAEGSILNGQNVRPVIWNVFTSGTAMNNTAVLDGFTVMNGDGGNSYSGGINNYYASPTLRNLVVKNNINTTINSLTGGGINNNYSSPIITNTIIKGNTATRGSAMANVSSSNPVLTNVLMTGNTATHPDDYFKYTVATNSSGTYTNVTIAGNNGIPLQAGDGTAHYNNVIAIGNAGTFSSSYVKNSIISGNTDLTNGNIDASLYSLTDIFTDPTNGDYTLKGGSVAINAGSNALYAGLDANTKDLAGNARVYKFSTTGIIDIGAYESSYNTPLFPDANGIIYVTQDGTGNKSGKDWGNATADLHNAIQTTGVTKVFVAVGNYKVGNSSFIMKNNVEIYGGFDPDAGITILAHNRILPNHGVSGGSVLDGEGARPVIWNNFTSGTALNNSAVLDGFTLKNGGSSDNGGGIYNRYASPVLRNLVITENNANYGAGIYNDQSSPKVSFTKITKNVAAFGGGVHNTQSSPTFTQVEITGNTAYGNLEYSAIKHFAGTCTLINVTISGNNSYKALYNGGTFIIENSIVYGGTFGSIPYTLKNSLVEGNTATSNGNIDATGISIGDIFANPSAGDYTLNENSPAIDAGNAAYYVGLDENTRDLAGNARVYKYNNGGIIDMGAYETPYANAIMTPDANGIIYVRETSAGDKTGKSWANATSNLKKAIQTAGVQQVWVATGTYPANNIQLKNDVAVYGGFDPDHGIVDLSGSRILPDPETNISGTVINGRNFGIIISNNNNGLNNTAVLDGFTLTNGKGSSGGAIYNNGASPMLRNLWIKGNTADDDGGGILNQNASSPVMTNITVSGNTARYGGGIFNRANSSPVMTNVVIKNNTTVEDGGGIYNDAASSPVMTNVAVTGNIAKNGAGIYNRTNSSPTLTNTTIANNTGSTTLYATDGTTSLVNSIVFGAVSGSYSPKYSLIQGNNDFTNGNMDAAGITLNDIFNNPSAKDYTLKSGSVAINAGSNALYAGLDAATKDLAGNQRLYGGVIDMGAYEAQSLTQIINPITDVVKVYGDAAFEPGATATSGLTVAYSSSDNSIAEAYQDAADNNKWKLRLKKAGTVTITASQPGDSTWPAATNVDFALTINKKPVTLAFTAAAVSKTYDGGTTVPITAANLSFTTGDIINSDDVQAQISLSGASYNTKDVGSNKIITLQLSALSLSGTDAGNYMISNTADLYKNAQITQATLSVKANNASKIYDALPYSGGNGVSYLGFVGGEDENVLGGTLTYTGSSQNAVMTGTYEIMPGGYSSSNYAITFVAGNLTISPNTVNTISFVSQTSGATLNKVYGDATINAAAVSSTGLAVSYSSSNPAVATVDGSGQVTLKGVGSTTIQAQQPGDANHGAATAIDITVVVAPKPVTVKATAQSKVYGAAEPVLSYTANPALLGSDSFSGSLSRTAGENVGAYNITQGSLTAGSNYAITYTGADLTITPKAITVTADAKSKAFGTADPVLTYTSTGLVTGDVLTGSLSRTAGESVGTYPITQGTLNGGANYTINYTSANFTIGTNVVTITAEAKTKVYGASDPALTYTVSGLAPGDVLTGSLSRAAGENAGAYSITQGTLIAGSGYVVNFTGSSLSITPKAVVVTAEAKTKVYGAANPTLTYSVSGLVGADALTGSLTRTPGESVGIYAISQGSLKAGSNYTVTYTGANLTINPKAVTVTATAQSKVYGAADPWLTYTVNPALEAGDSFTGTLTRTVGENVGTYAIAQGSLTADANYAVTYTGADLTITPKPVTVMATAQSKIYGAADPALTYTVNPALEADDSFTGTLSRTVGENVGTYAINKGSLALNSNYTLNYVGADFTISLNAVNTLSFTAQTAGATLNRVYGDAVINAAAVSSAGLAVSYTSSNPAVATVDGSGQVTLKGVGSTTIQAQQPGDANHGAATAINITVVVTPKPVTVTATAQSKVYGAADPILTYTVNPALKAGDSFIGTLSRTVGENVGTYAINKGSLALSSNYTLNYVGADFTISPNAVNTLSFTAQTAGATLNRVYGDAAINAAAVSSAGLAVSYSSSNPAVATVDGSGQVTLKGVGSTTIQAQQPGDANHGAATAINITVVVAPKPVTVTATAQSKVYGAADPILNYTVNGLVGADAMTGSLSRTPGENVGAYAISQGSLTASSNYAITYTGADLTITPKAITVTADAKSKAFGTADPVLTYTSTGLVTGDALTGSLTRIVGEAVGTYPITQGTLTGGANYTINYTSANFTIGTNVVTITAEAKTKVYGASDPALTYTVSGLAPGDVLTGSLSRAAGENTGAYSITQGTLTAGSGYVVNFTGSSLSITPKAVVVTAEAKTKVYGAANPTLTYSVSGLVGADALTGSLTRTPGESVGIYAISQGSLTAGSNYAVTYTGADFTITPKAITVTADAKSKAFGTADPWLTYTVNPALEAGDSFTGTLSRAIGEAAGVYPITQGTLTAGANYLINFTSANFTIGTNVVTITAEAKTKVYGAAEPEFTYTVSGLAPGDVLTGSLSRAAGENVGTYSITQGTLTAGPGYVVSFTGSNLTITPKVVTVTANAKSKAYGAADPTLTYTVSGLVGADALTGSLTRTAGESVGTYPIMQGSLSGGTNYIINFTPASLTIGNHIVTVIADAKTKVYGAAEPEFTYTVSGLAPDDVLTGSLTRVAGENAGNYTITRGTLSAGAGYTINYIAADLTITPKAISVIAGAKSKTFGAADPALTYIVSGLVGNDVLSGSLIRTAGESVGTYPITQGTLTAGANYVINFTSANFTISSNIVTITAEAKTKVYGAADPKFTYAVSGLAPGDVLTGSLARAAGENIGDYAITQGTLSAGANYTITYKGADLIIQPKNLIITVDTKSKIYGDTEPALTYKVNGLVGTDALSGSLTRAAGESAGSYAITQGTLTADPNYHIQFGGADFSIEKAPLTVSALSVQLCAGSTFPVFAVSYGGFKNGDTEKNLTAKPVVSANATAGSAPGTYILTPAGAVSANYTFNYVTGQLTLLALPQANLTSNVMAINKGEMAQLTASGGVRYEWYEGSNQLSGQQATIQVRPLVTTTYTVRVFNAGGCSEVKTITITVNDNYDAVKATNLLTPNGDGMNDYWTVSNIDIFPGNEVKVFDRARRIVYQKKNYDNSWDGTVNGYPLAEGTYYYLIDFGKDKPKLKGFITILRNK